MSARKAIREFTASGEVWPQKRLDELRRLWAAGLSTQKIADEMHTTKNAVVGKAHRLNLPERPSPIRPRRAPDAPRPAWMPRLQPIPLSTLMEEAAMKPPQDVPKPAEAVECKPESRPPWGGAAALEAAKAHQRPAAVVAKPSAIDMLRPAPVPLRSGQGCQFITDEKAGPGWKPIFCDDPRQEGSSYCGTHHKICHTKVAAWGQRI